MNFELIHEDCGCCEGGSTTGQMTLQQEDASLIYFAMLEYRDSLEASLKESFEKCGARGQLPFENDAFLHATLSQINHFLHEFLTDHPVEQSDKIRAWVDAI